ncbi:hypothetical protein LTR94_029255, partial [Friedmanniomyces endolithicus]
APSNFERLVYEASGQDPQTVRHVFETFADAGSVAFEEPLLSALRAEVSAQSISEDETRDEIAYAYKTWGRVICPHTAVALAVARRQDRAQGPIVALSTAHPSKFGDFVASVLGFEPDPAPVIEALDDRPERMTVIEPSLEAALAAMAAAKS